ncbi:phosphate/phosphite/phosphonate ABC transporter substrate-binding protein [Plantactinospora endophytica]|uniref:Phosphate-import protein PhnD n=1 Tax=Plantactinospora endophytica TaxID=673535 RepID=A0ABQ4E7G8_9ACTN|nr:phosphate/phosphite/phosphonate ABC transporter substrate-binding protein [Plantactinospora endophytica]GIG90670.1 phosphate-import protein PhnD [Plantactinospora endophytica]
MTTPRTRKLRLLAVMTAIALATAGCGGDSEEPANGTNANDWPDKIVFAATPSGEARTFDDDYGPFVKALSRDVGIKIETFQAADYAGVIEGMIAGTVDVAQLGAFSYALAVQNGAKIEPSGVRIHAKGDQAGYVIYGMVPTSSAIKGFADFRGKTVCFPDPASTTTLIPLFEFHKAGMTVDKDFKRLTVPAGATIPRTVKRGDCQVGLASQAQLESAIRQGDVKQNDLKVVWEVRAPGSPLATRTELPQDLRNKVREATNRINAEYLEQQGFCTGDACLISASGDYGFIPIDGTYYQVIWDACEATRIDACGPIGS